MNEKPNTTTKITSRRLKIFDVLAAPALLWLAFFAFVTGCDVGVEMSVGMPERDD